MTEKNRLPKIFAGILILIIISALAAVCILDLNGSHSISESDLNEYSVSEYNFTKSDINDCCGEKYWSPALVFDARTNYSEINSLMVKYFDYPEIKWEITYDNYYLNYILHSEKDEYSDSFSYLNEQNCVNQDDIMVLTNPKADEHHRINYLFSIGGPREEREALLSDERFKSLDITPALKVLIWYCGDDKEKKKQIVSSLNLINQDCDYVFAVKLDSGYLPRLCNPFYSNADNTGREWTPLIGFMPGTDDEKINNLIENIMPQNTSLSIRDGKDSYHANYFVDISENPEEKLDVISHFLDVSTYGWLYYENIEFSESNESKNNFYPVSFSESLDRFTGYVINSLGKENIILRPAKLVELDDFVLNDSSFENSYDKLEEIYRLEDVAFIVESFRRGGYNF